MAGSWQVHGRAIYGSGLCQLIFLTTRFCFYWTSQCDILSPEKQSQFYSMKYANFVGEYQLYRAKARL
jgi:hypothetical protein